MSALSDKIAEVSSAFDAALGRVQGDVDTLNAKVAELQAKVDAGSASDADMAALDELRGRIDALDPTKPDVLPETPPTSEVPPTTEPVPNPNPETPPSTEVPPSTETPPPDGTTNVDQPPSPDAAQAQRSRR